MSREVGKGHQDGLENAQGAGVGALMVATAINQVPPRLSLYLQIANEHSLLLRRGLTELTSLLLCNLQSWK